jgi:hypothetical protein
VALLAQEDSRKAPQGFRLADLLGSMMFMVAKK